MAQVSWFSPVVVTDGTGSSYLGPYGLLTQLRAAASGAQLYDLAAVDFERDTLETHRKDRVARDLEHFPFPDLPYGIALVASSGPLVTAWPHGGNRHLWVDDHWVLSTTRTGALEAASPTATYTVTKITVTATSAAIHTTDPATPTVILDGPVVTWLHAVTGGEEQLTPVPASPAVVFGELTGRIRSAFLRADGLVRIEAEMS